MKEIYYGKIPLGVPLQKRPADKYASHPYPVLVNECVYSPTVKPLGITLRQILKDTTIDSGAYQSSVRPLDVTLRPSLLQKYIDDNDVYIPLVKSLDITLKSPLINRNVNDYAYMSYVKPLDITLNQLVIEHTEDDKDAYISSIKLLDIILKTGA